jgi:hypothetical protein
MHGIDEKCIENVCPNAEGQLQLERHNCGWENIKMDLREKMCERVDWAQMGHFMIQQWIHVK